MKIKLLTKRQNEVMSVLWGSDLPLSANQICNENESLNMNTVQQVLKALLKMQFIKVEDIGYSNTVLTRLYSPVVKQADYLQFLFVPVYSCVEQSEVQDYIFHSLRLKSWLQ